MRPLDRTRAELARAGLTQAVFADAETVAALGGYSASAEDWPIKDPFGAGPALLVVTATDAVLVVAAAHAGRAEAPDVRVLAYRSYDHLRPPDPWRELEAAIAELPLTPGSVGVDAGALPLRVADLLGSRGCEPVDVEGALAELNRIKLPDELEAIRRASRLADVVQQAVKDHARAGMTEVELATLAHMEMNRVAGRRTPAVLTLSTGRGTDDGGAEATDRMIEPGDLVLTDVSPWVAGAWSDTANAVLVGEPTAEHRRVFDALRRTLELAIDLCRPGVAANDVDRRVRAALEQFGPTYAHHTGHGIGATWSEEPRITPYNTRRIEEGMVLAVEPAVYRPGWGGIRLEHVFRVGADGNEVITEFEHTL